MVKKHLNVRLEGRHGRPIATDVVSIPNEEKKPVIIFCHGYKGFKDWGAWNIMAEKFAAKGFIFVKFNFAFNGGTLEEPIDFPDLEAFGQNTFTKELDDLDVVIDWATSKEFPFFETADLSRLTLIGHSRGGGIVVIKASEDERVRKVVTLASVSDFGSRFPRGDELAEWKSKGISYVENSRTKQQMPHQYEFYEDFKRNEERLTISRATKELDIPVLIVHGTDDPTVSVENAKDLHKWALKSELVLLEGSDHVFEASHPWSSKDLPEAMLKIIEKTSDFINKRE